MRRKAIIVGSPGAVSEVEDYLAGVMSDAVSYEKFLRSDNGGAWEESEIMVAWHPDSRELRSKLDSFHLDYSLTIFCGHGGAIDGKALIQLDPSNRYQVMWADDFRTRATRQLTIIDACRVDESPSRRLLKEGSSTFHGDGRDLYREGCRALYDQHIAAAGENRVMMWGCKRGQVAGEEPEGGYFSHALVRLSQQWVDANRSRNGSPRTVLDVRKAFWPAHAHVTDAHYPQEPVLYSGRGTVTFPFAVA